MRIGLGIGLNKFRGGQAAGITGLLDQYTGAAAAFSLDTLIYGDHSVEDTAVGSETEVNSPNPGDNPAAPYTVRVRRSTTPSAVRSFTHTEVGNGTLVTWVGAGNDGFVEAWYDQSGNGNHATQANAAAQPKIVDAGVLVEENGKPAVDFDGVDDYLFKVFSLDVTLGYTNFYVCNITNSGTQFILASVKNTSNRYAIGINNVGNYQSTKRTAVITSDAATYTSGQVLLSDNEAPEIYLDGVLGSASVGTLNNAFVSEILTIGKNSAAAGAQHVSGVIQEIILYNSDQSANRTAIESALNDYYEIY